MQALGAKLRNFLREEGGATAIEYGLIASLVAVGILVAMTTLGGGVTNMFGAISSRAGDELDNAMARQGG